jgi:hypothetical protein
MTPKPGEYEKARLVKKLREARERLGKLGGRKSYAAAMPETVTLAKQLHAEGLSYRKIAAELAARGHVTGGANRMQHRQFRKCSGSGFDQRPLIRWQHDWRQ